MRICLLTTQDLDTESFPADDWPCDPRPFLPDADWHVQVLSKSTSVETVTGLVAEGFDLFFNLCDGAADQGTPGIEVVETLERLCVPFTGATSVYYEPSRVQMKAACGAQGIPTPAWVLAESSADVEHAARTLTFPLFVKHHSSYASISLSRASRVVTPAGLRRQARKIMSRHGKALIEEYIDGAEATVLVSENPDDRHRDVDAFLLELTQASGRGAKKSKGPAMAIALGLFAVTVTATRMVSAGSVLGAIGLGVSVMMLPPNDPVLRGITVTVCLLVIVRHRSNIRRILAGTESRLGQKAVADPEPDGDE